METRPPQKSFWMVPFTVQATRGILRDQLARRATMAVCLLVALVFVICGLTLFRAWLDPHEHPVRFILYWLVCVWQTVLVLLLALLDILLVRAEARAARKALGEGVKQEDASGE
jgi:hypothetical protein